MRGPRQPPPRGGPWASARPSELAYARLWSRRRLRAGIRTRALPDIVCTGRLQVGRGGTSSPPLGDVRQGSRTPITFEIRCVERWGSARPRCAVAVRAVAVRARRSAWRRQCAATDVHRHDDLRMACVRTAECTRALCRSFDKIAATVGSGAAEQWSGGARWFGRRVGSAAALTSAIIFRRWSRLYRLCAFCAGGGLEGTRIGCPERVRTRGYACRVRA